jgi:Fic family protein
MKGTIGKEVVYRTFKQGTFAGKFPDMSRIIPSKNQTKARKRFAKAVAYAQIVMKSHKGGRDNKAGKDKAVYHAAIKDYMSRFDAGKPVNIALPEEVQNVIKLFSLSEAQLRALAYINDHKKLTNRDYQEMNAVSKATATRHLQELAAQGIIISNNGKGAGAYYITGSPWKKE